MSSARLVLPWDAPRDEWLAARTPGVTASEAAAVLGLSPYESPYSLYLRKRGEIGDQPDNDSMRWGRRLEAAIADEYAERHPELHVAKAGLYANGDRPWQMATPDRLLYEHDASGVVSVLECKTDGGLDGWGDDGTDDIPVHYRAQTLWQMDVMGVETGTVALLARGRTYREYVIGRDDDDLTLMREAALEFLDRVKAGDPPDLDWRPATASALKALHPSVVDVDVEIDVILAAEYRHACDQMRRAEDAKRQAENEMRAALGDGRYAVAAGARVASRSVYDMTVIDRDVLRRDHPDAYAACRTSTTVNKLIPARRNHG